MVETTKRLQSNHPKTCQKVRKVKFAWQKALGMGEKGVSRFSQWERPISQRYVDGFELIFLPGA